MDLVTILSKHFVPYAPPAPTKPSQLLGSIQPPNWVVFIHVGYIGYSYGENKRCSEKRRAKGF